MLVSANQKKLIAWAFCLLFAIVAGFVVGGFVFAVFHTSAFVAASTGGVAFVAVGGWGVAVIGPFTFTDDRRTPPGGSGSGAPAP